MLGGTAGDYVRRGGGTSRARRVGLVDSADMAPSHPVRFGLKFSQQVHPIGVHTDVWRIGDDAGFDHIWPFDHLIALGPDPMAPIFDGWTALGAMAALTTRARMGLNVTGNLYRHPGLMAKIAVTVDHLSNGRLEFGIGTGWNEPEFTQFGLPFPSSGDPATLRRSINVTLAGADTTLAKAEAAVKAGFSELLIMIGARGQAMPAVDPRKRAEEAAALLPRLRALG